MKVIGKSSARFLSIIERLPNTWTTIYQLAKLDTDDFVTVTRSNVLTPFMTAKELSSALGKEKQAKNKKEASSNQVADFCIYTNNLNTDQKKQLFIKINELQKAFAFKMEVADSFKDALIAEELKLAA